MNEEIHTNYIPLLENDKQFVNIIFKKGDRTRKNNFGSLKVENKQIVLIGYNLLAGIERVNMYVVH